MVIMFIKTTFKNRVTNNFHYSRNAVISMMRNLNINFLGKHFFIQSFYSLFYGLTKR